MNEIDTAIYGIDFAREQKHIVHPEDMTEQVRRIIEVYEVYKDDPETCHIALDELMETVLSICGYHEAVQLIRKSTRWYA